MHFDRLAGERKLRRGGEVIAASTLPLIALLALYAALVQLATIAAIVVGLIR